MKFDGVDFAEAKDRLKREQGLLVPLTIGRRSSRRMTVTDEPVRPPSAIWQATGWRLVERATQTLWSEAGRAAQRYLQEQRLLELATIQRWRLGYIPSTVHMPFSAFGLPEDSAHPQGLWLPRGLLIPCFTDDGTLWGLHIRRHDEREGWNVTQRKMPFVRGSKQALWGAQNTDRRVVALCGGEWDAMLGQQAAGEWAGFCALTTGEGSRLTPDWLTYLLGADVLLVLYDADEAGQTGAWRQIFSATARAVICPPPALRPGDKDLTDFARAGGQLSEWIGKMRAGHLRDDAKNLAMRLTALEGMRQDRFSYWSDFQRDYAALLRGVAGGSL